MAPPLPSPAGRSSSSGLLSQVGAQIWPGSPGKQETARRGWINGIITRGGLPRAIVTDQSGPEVLQPLCVLGHRRSGKRAVIRQSPFGQGLSQQDLLPVLQITSAKGHGGTTCSSLGKASCPPSPLACCNLSVPFCLPFSEEWLWP